MPQIANLSNVIFMDSHTLWLCIQNHPKNIVTQGEAQKIATYMREQGWIFKQKQQTDDYAALTFLSGLNDLDDRNFGLSESAQAVFVACQHTGIAKTVHDCQLISDWMTLTGYSFEHIQNGELLSNTQGSSQFYWFQESPDKGCIKKITPALRSVARSTGLLSLILD